MVTARVVAIAIFVLIVATVGVALPQTIYNPTRVEFTHDQHTNPCPTTGTATCIVKYQIEFWLPGVDPTTGSPVQTSEIPKTIVTSTGTANTWTARLTEVVPPFAAPTGTTYVARLRAVDDVGQQSVRSDASNPFEYRAVPQTPAAVSLR